jgi:hypothetical protein
MSVCEQPGTKTRLEAAFSEVLGTSIALKTTIQQVSGNSAAPYKPKGARASQKELNDILNDPSVKTLILGMNAKVTGVEEDTPAASPEDAGPTE